MILLPVPTYVILLRTSVTISLIISEFSSCVLFSVLTSALSWRALVCRDFSCWFASGDNLASVGKPIVRLLLVTTRQSGAIGMQRRDRISFCILGSYCYT